MKNNATNITHKVWRTKGVTKVRLEFTVDEDKYFKKDEIEARLALTSKWLAKHLVTFADFDQAYTLDLLEDALNALGEGLGRWDNCLHSERNAKRAKTAARMLKNAYNFESCKDKSYINWSSRHKHWHKNLPRGYSQWMTTELHDNAMKLDRDELISLIESKLNQKSKTENLFHLRWRLN